MNSSSALSYSSPEALPISGHCDGTKSLSLRLLSTPGATALSRFRSARTNSTSLALLALVLVPAAARA